MAIGTYAQLKTAVASWLKRSDLTAVIPDFIALAEAQIRRDVRCRTMEQIATGTLAASTLALPTRFLEARNVALDGWPQSYVTPQEFTEQTDWNAGNYTVKGELFYFQTASGDYSIDYWQSFAALSADSDTNWLLTNAPDVYLFGALTEAMSYIEGDPSVYAAKYVIATKRVNGAEQKARFPGPLQVRSSGLIA